MRRLSLLVGLLVVVAALTACSSSSGANGESVDERLASAKQSFDDAKYIGFDLTSDNLPDGVSALKSAEGTGTHAPAFDGKIEVVKGLTFTAALRAVDGKVYAELPFVGWTTIDPETYGAPDPALLMDTQHGLSSLLTATRSPQVTGSERSGDTVLTKIEGTLPAHEVQRLFGAAGDSEFGVTYTLTEDDSLHGVTITGPFYGDEHGDTTYSIVLDLDADPVTVTAPE